MSDSHLRPADLSFSRQQEMLAVARDRDVRLLSVHVQRKSIIQPGKGEENLAYAHRTIDAAAEMGMRFFSTGLHQPLSDAQRAALWFWTAPGPGRSRRRGYPLARRPPFA